MKGLVLGPAETVARHAIAERGLSAAINRAKLEAVRNGLGTEGVVRVLRAALEQEERLLAEVRAHERSYR